MKNILVLHYSQTGQLTSILTNFLKPFSSTDFTIEILNVKPVNDFEFPWSGERFFDAMPESVLGIPVELEEINPTLTKYDLVILGYQPWYLSPSIPFNSIFENKKIQDILNNTNVITVIGSRNMWINAHEIVKKKLKQVNANLIGNIAFIDRHQNHISALTILHWMLNGKKDRYRGILPNPGVSDTDIASADTFGKIVVQKIQENKLEELQQTLVDAKAVEVKTNLLFIEERAPRLFSIWAGVISKKTNRKKWLTIFKYYLIVALFIVAPIILVIYSIFFKPFLGKSIKRKKNFYLGLS